MLKQISGSVATLAVVSSSVSVSWAIAPGVSQLKTCQNFVANQYKVSANSTQVTVNRSGLLGGYFINWSVLQYRAGGYCFVTANNSTVQFRVERGPKPDQIATPPRPDPTPDYSNQVFRNIPGYERGLRVKLSGYTDVSRKRRNFLVKNDVSTIDFRWYGDCTTEDQVYDGQKYLGYDRNARSLLAYACSLKPTSPRPQPR